MSKNNGLRTWLLGVLFAIVMAASGYIVNSMAGDVEKLELKNSTQDERMDTIDARLTVQLYEFRVCISKNNVAQEKESTRSQLVDSLQAVDLEEIKTNQKEILRILGELR